MAKYQFLYDLKTPEKTWRGSGKHYFKNGEVSSEAGRITDMEGPHGLYWCLDTIMHKVPADTDPDIDHMPHYHVHGYETFFVDSGSLYLYINGQRAEAKKGDIVHLQAGQAHGMLFKEEVKWRGTYHDYQVYHEAGDVRRVHEYLPETKDDPDLNALMPRGEMDNIPLEPFLYTDVPTEQCLGIKNISRPHASYDMFPGLSLKVVVERWENGGTKEMVCAVMEPGFTAEWVKYPKLRELLYVRSGKVKFTVLGEEFIADDECVVDIPRFAPHSIEVLEHSEVYDMGGQSYWSLFMQNYASILKHKPDTLTPEKLDELKKKFDIQIKSIGMK
ncbi:MAG: cupin domain-containing protein [Oscillospiraceae bacterium]|nr:cupin domain-containing protein [Oscillospiraceae bacterium]